jgi:hypothetical protein
MMPKEMLRQAHRELRCVSASCGQPVLEFRDRPSVSHYLATGQCQCCQDRIYGRR